jgi:hypothetical protein
MNTKSRNFKVAPEFEHLFSFSNDEEKLEHRAQMISYRILSEVEKFCDLHNMKMKDLAKMIDTSPSYVTQLFRGNKQVNMNFMAKFEEVTQMLFDFTLMPEKEQHDELSWYQYSAEAFKKVKEANPGKVYCFAIDGGKTDKTNQLVNKLNSEAEAYPSKQIA